MRSETPYEITSLIVQQASVRRDSKFLDVRTLSNIALVSKHLYPHAIRLLYKTARLTYVPSSLLTAFGTISPTLVGTLLIQGVINPNKDHRKYAPVELAGWVQLDSTVERMVNLETVIYEVNRRSLRFSTALANLPKLRHLSIGNAENLNDAHGFISLPALTSFTVTWNPNRKGQLPSIQQILNNSKNTLRKLDITVGALSSRYPASILSLVFQQDVKLSLKELRVDAYFDPAFTTALLRAIDWDCIEILSLKGNARPFLAAFSAPPHLRDLRLSIAAWSFLRSFNTLQKLHLTFDNEINLAAIAHHPGLRDITLNNEHPLSATQLSLLAASCMQLSNLSLTVVFTQFRALANALASLPLDRLTLKSSYSNAVIPLPNMVQLVMGPYPGYVPDGLDGALGLLLVTGVRATDITITGIVVDSTSQFGSSQSKMSTKRWRKNVMWDGPSTPVEEGGSTGDLFRFQGVAWCLWEKEDAIRRMTYPEF